MDISNWITVAAIVLGPILAVQVQARLDHRREVRRRKADTFRILMETRASRLSREHVQALNSIDVAFYGTSKRDKAVTNAWREYFDNLCNPQDVHLREQVFVSLLEKMSESLGFKFDRTSLKRQAYTPQGHSDLEADATSIRKGLIDMIDGGRAIRVAIDPATSTSAEKDAAPKIGNHKR